MPSFCHTADLAVITELKFLRAKEEAVPFAIAPCVLHFAWCRPDTQQHVSWFSWHRGHGELDAYDLLGDAADDSSYSWTPSEVAAEERRCMPSNHGPAPVHLAVQQFANEPNGCVCSVDLTVL